MLAERDLNEFAGIDKFNDKKDQYCYMVFDFVQYDLAKVIAALHQRRQALSVKDIKALSFQFCQGWLG
jgi:hypothetical protein